MKKLLAICLLALCLAPAVMARDIAPVVDAAWLEANLANPRLAVLDMRAPADFKAGHVPGAASVLGSTVYVAKGELKNEVPEADDLTDVLQAAGVKADSLVVVVETDASRIAWATRVAWTLRYAGLANVAILDGGHKAWAAAGKPVQTEAVAKSGDFQVKKYAEALFADKAYVLKATKSQIVDARTYDSYFGLSKQAFVAQAGHFPGAYPLPYTWITNADGMVRPKAELEAMAAKLGLNAKTETIVLCDSGVLCTAWWWIFSEVLEWKNVRSFDGSSQVLTTDATLKAADPAVKYVTHTWR